LRFGHIRHKFSSLTDIALSRASLVARGCVVSLTRYSEIVTKHAREWAVLAREKLRPADAGHDAPAPDITAEHYGPDDTILYAVGDIHGRADLLEKLIDQIDQDQARTKVPGRLIFLGDYIDRGLQSRQVIDILLSERVQAMEPLFIKGNHEAAMMDFVGNPETGPIWAKYGGRETLVSYGVRPPRSLTFNHEWVTAHEEFIEALPLAHENFMLNLRLSIRLGDFGFVHAGVRPNIDFDEQDEKDLLWIRDEFLHGKLKMNLTIVHGHTPVDEPSNAAQKINVDTGAYYSGHLTAARIEGNNITFISTANQG